MAQHLTEAQKRAKKKYRKKVKSITIEFYPTEMLLIEQIEKNEPKQTYIKNLIRKDIESPTV
jgi:hypothetical protein